MGSRILVTEAEEMARRVVSDYYGPTALESGRRKLLVDAITEAIQQAIAQAEARRLAAAAKHEPIARYVELSGELIASSRECWQECSCGWDSRSGQSWADHIKGLKEQQ